MGFTAAQFGSRRQGGLAIPQPSLPDVRPFSPSSPQRASSGQTGENLTLRERLAIEDEFATKRADREALAKKSLDEETLRRDATERLSLEGILFPERASAVPRATLEIGGVSARRPEATGGVVFQEDGGAVPSATLGTGNLSPRRPQTLADILGGPDAGAAQDETGGVEFEQQTVRPNFQPNIPKKVLQKAAEQKILQQVAPKPSRESSPAVGRVRLTQAHVDSGQFGPNARVGDYYDAYVDSTGKVHSVLAPTKPSNVGDALESAADTLYGDEPWFNGFGSLSQEQKRNAKAYAIDDEKRTAASKSEGRVEGATQVAISPEKYRKYRLLDDEGNVVGLPANTTEARARELGAVALTEKDSDALQGIAFSGKIIEYLDELSQQVFTAKTAFEALGEGAADYAGAKTGFDEAAKVYRDSASAFLAPTSRSVFLEKGVLTDKDIERLERAISGFGDSKNVSMAKMGMLRLLIEQASAITKGAIFGKTIPTNWEPEKARILGIIAPEGQKTGAPPPPQKNKSGGPPPKQGKSGSPSTKFRGVDIEPMP